MSLGERLLDLRKSKHLSQEEVADKLNVSRQTISKWETDSSTPDFDKIIPICELYGISSNELLSGEKEETKQAKDDSIIKRKRAKGISIAVFTYFVAIVWIMVTIPVFDMHPVLASGVFLLICGVATALIVYTCSVYKKEKVKKNKNPLLKKIDDIVSIITLVIYLIVSFLTMAWHITWIIWIIYALVIEIIKLIFMLKENENEK